MQRNCAKRNAYNAGKNATRQELVHQHMCNHYRRILNAKKVVDTSPPYCYKARRPSSGKRPVPPLPSGLNLKTKPSFRCKNVSPVQTDRSVSTNSYRESAAGGQSFPRSPYHTGCLDEPTGVGLSDRKTHLNKSLIDRITYDTKRGPSAYCDCTWTDRKADQNVKIPVQIRKSKSDICQTGSISNVAPEPKPVRHHEQSHSKSSDPLLAAYMREIQDCSKVCYCCTVCGSEYKKTISVSHQKIEQSQTSSRDSAYNGGVSSPPESRSPTPDERAAKGQECCDRVRQRVPPDTSYPEVVSVERKTPERRLTDSVKCAPVKSPEVFRTGNSRDETPREGYALPCTTSCERLVKARCHEETRKMKEDAKYIKFVQDITVEILEKKLYTNKALKKVMKRHILNNVQTLDKVRMMKEVDNLRIQLGIPEDETIFHLDLAEKESSGDLLKDCRVISDSEFVLPDGLIEPMTPGRSEEEEEDRDTDDGSTDSGGKSRVPSGPRRKSVVTQDVETPPSDSETEKELVSVIHVSKGPVREVKRKMQDSSNQSSSEEASRPVERKKVLRPREHKPASSSSVSSSSSEIEEKIMGEGDKSNRSYDEDGDDDDDDDVEDYRNEVKEEEDKIVQKNVYERGFQGVRDSLDKPRTMVNDSSVAKSSGSHKKSRSVSFENNKNVRVYEKRVIGVKMTSGKCSKNCKKV